MLVKLYHFPKVQGEHKKCWNHHQGTNQYANIQSFNMYKYTYINSLDIDMTYAIYSIHVIKYVDKHSEGGNHGIGVNNLFFTKLINIQKHVQLKKMRNSWQNGQLQKNRKPVSRHLCIVVDMKEQIHSIRLYPTNAKQLKHVQWFTTMHQIQWNDRLLVLSPPPCQHPVGSVSVSFKFHLCLLPIFIHSLSSIITDTFLILPS